MTSEGTQYWTVISVCYKIPAAQAQLIYIHSINQDSFKHPNGSSKTEMAKEMDFKKAMMKVLV